MKEIRNRNKIGFNPIVLIKAPVSHRLYRQLTSLMMSIVIFMVTIFGNATVTFADKKDDIVNRIIEQYQNGDISRDEAKRALIRNGVTNSPIIDLNEDEEGNEIATDSDLVKKLGEKDRLIDEKIKKIIEDNRDDDTSVVFAWHHEDADSIIDELSDVATKSELKKSEADNNQESKKSVGIYYDKFNKTSKSSETADSETESENIAEAVDTEDDTAVDEESVSEGEVSDENQASEEMMEDDSLDEDEENEDYNSVDEDEVFENDSQDKESEDFDSAEEDEVSENDSQDEEDEVSGSVDPYEFSMNDLQDEETEVFESADSGEVFENDSEDEEDEIVDSSASEEVINVASQDEVPESVDPYEFFMNDLQDKETEVFESADSGEVFENDSEDEEDEIIDSAASEEVIDDASRDEEDAEENSDIVETSEADENESKNEDKEENHSVIKVDEFFEIDSYVENEDSDSENSEEETTEAETEAAKTIGIMAHSDKNAIAQTAEDVEAEVDADAETDAETETKAAKAIGILAHSDKTAIALTEENKDSAEEEKDYDVIDLSEYVTVSSAVKKFHEEWIESESFDSGNKIGLTLYFSIPEDVMYDKDTRVAAYSMPEGLTSQFEGKGKVISGDETVGTYKLKKNEIEITFDTAFVKSGKSIEGALFFKGRVENKTDEDCLTIDLGGTAGNLDVYKEIKKTVVSDDGKVTVTATFGASTFDGDVTLYAESLDEETLLDVENAFNEKLQEDELKVSDMYTYDVFFLDEDDERIEPDGHVSVKMTFNNPIESENKEDIKVFHVKNNDLSDIEDLTPMDDTVIKENSEGEVKNVELVADSFSYFSVFVSTADTDPILVNIEDLLTDINLYIDDTIVDSSNNIWTIYDQSKSYKLNLTFEENGKDHQFPQNGLDNNTWMYYDIPEALYIEDKGPIEFTATVDDVEIEGNKLIIDKTEHRIYLQWNTSSPNYSKLAGSPDVVIHASLNGKFDLNEQSTEIKFSEEVKRTIVLDNKLNFWKEGEYSSEDNKVHYKVNLVSVGTSKNIEVKDEISGTLLGLDKNSISVVKIYDNTESKLSLGEDYTIEDLSNGFKINIAEMKHDEKIVITYTASLKRALNLGEVIVDSDRKNTVNIKDQTHTYSPIDHYVDVKSSLKKSANLDGSTKTDKNGNRYQLITWTIKANEGHYQNISFIKDSIAENSRSIMSYEGDSISVNIYHANGQTEWNKKISYEDILNDERNGWTWSVTDIDPTAYYEITYQTRVNLEEVFGNTEVANNVSTNYGGTSATQSIGTKIHSKKAVKKTSDKITWEIKISVPAEGYTKLEVEDCLPNTWIDKLYLDSFDKTISIRDDNNEDYLKNNLCVIKTYSDYIKKLEGDTVSTSSNKGNYVKFVFYQNNKHTVSGVAKSNSERIITIRYTTKTNSNWVDACANTANPDGWYNFHTNTAFIKTDKGDSNLYDRVYIFKSLDKQQYSSIYDKTGVITKDGTQTEPWIVYIYDLVLSNINSEETVITDTFDEPLRYISGFNGDKGNDYWVGRITGGTKWNLDNKTNSVKAEITELSNNKIQIKLKNIPKTAEGEYYDFYRVRYYLGIPRSEARNLAIANKGSVSLNNTATWAGSNLSDSVQVKYDYKPLNKYGTYDSTKNVIPYTIEINKDKLKLLGSGTLTLKDTYEQQTIDIQSIRITTEDKNGVKGDNSDKKITCKINEEHNLLTFEGIPDETYVTITYNGIPVFTSQTVLLVNTAELVGNEIRHEAWATFNASADSYGDSIWLKLLKCDAKDATKYLPGAEFELYEVDTDSNGNECLNKLYVLKDEEPTEEAITFTTGSDGSVKIELDYEKTGQVLYDKKKYCLVETKAPDGYVKDKINKYYFTIVIPKAGESIDTSAHDIYNVGSIITISNEKVFAFALPDTGSFGVNIMYLMGIVMVALGGIFLILRRRKENQL